MWYKNSFRRHLCDMHIDDWNDEFLSKFSPEEYFDNLKTAKVQNAMIYFQSHVGLCYFPTKVGKMHNAFQGKEDMVKRLVNLCRENGISVTGYYSLIYNNWAYVNHPEWRMLPETFGKEVTHADRQPFAQNVINRYGVCCPNNKDYRAFVSKQMKEMADYFEVDGMFFDMTFWPKNCQCSACKARFKEETGYDLPKTVDWNDPIGRLLMKKRREWIGEFGQSVTDEMKSYMPHISVEHNVANIALPNGYNAEAEEVINACDYAGGDLYEGPYHQSFACKIYRNITKNQPFEYMFGRVAGTLSMHTTTKSEDMMLSEAMLTAAHHGATLVIDAIDPVGTMDKRVYSKIGKVFEKEMQYEKYLSEGDMIEDLGLYYTLRSKFNVHGERYSNYYGCLYSTINMIKNNVSCGITGGYHNINRYNVLVAPYLTEEDSYDYERIINYVKEGGSLYISGGDCKGLLKEFFGAEIKDRTNYNLVYITPKTENKKVANAFGWFNEKYPLYFNGNAPVAEGIDEKNVIATVTVPYTPQTSVKLASIHSDPPAYNTAIPAIAFKNYGKGKVLWSALPIENVQKPYHYSDLFLALLREFLDFKQTVVSNAPADVEVVAFADTDKKEITVSSVQLCDDKKARFVEPFTVSIKSEKAPKKVMSLPEETEFDFEYKDGFVTYKIENLKLFDMKKIIF